MELLLNIVWLLVATASCVFFARHHRARLGDRPGTFAVTVAVACIIFLLFPCISLSDDLHEVNCTFEDSSRKLVADFGLVQPAVLPAIRSSGLVEEQLHQQPTVSWLLFGLSKPRVLDGYVSPAEGRAPPPILFSALKSCSAKFSQ